MFKESGFSDRHLTKIDGSIAERKVLGFQSDEGFNFLKNDPKFHAEVQKTTDSIISSGFLKERESVLGNVDRTPEEEKELALKYVYERFLEISFIKNIESKNIQIEGRDPIKESKFDTEIKKAFKIRAAVSQVQRIADFNKTSNSDRYSENISTPFTVRMMGSLKQKLSKKLQNFQIIYNPAIFENDILKTHLDGIRGTDAYVIVISMKESEKQIRIFYLDYTGNPGKINDQSIIKKGEGIERQSDPDLSSEDAKLRVFIDFEKVMDDSVLAKMGNEMAVEIDRLYA
jgi:hypothetical protein